MTKNAPVLTLEDKKWRYERIRNLMKEKGLDAIVLGGNGGGTNSKVRYITGPYFKGASASMYVIFPLEGEPMPFAFRESRPYNMQNVRAHIDEYWFSTVRYAKVDEMVDFLNGVEKKNKKIGIDFTTINYNICNGIVKAYPDIEFVEFGEEIVHLMRVSSQNEIAHCREATRICDLVWDRMRTFLKPGLYEHEITAEWSKIMIENRCDITFNLVQTDRLDVSRFWFPDTRAPRKVEEGHMLMMEITAAYDGYWGQRVGCASMGKPDPILLKLNVAIEDARNEGAKMIMPGVSTYDVAKKIDDVINSHGFLNQNEFKTAPQGHIINLTLDCGTFWTRRKEDAFLLEENMVVQLHPAAAVKDFDIWKAGMFNGGIMYVLEKDGLKSLHSKPYEQLMIIE